MNFYRQLGMEGIKKRIYFENLDGLRFFCFLSVFLFHSFHTEQSSIQNSGVYLFISQDVFGNGNLGVNFFFVLSGFLITYLLIEEKKLNGQIDLKKFWMRRILRIWPLFYLCVIFGFYGFPILKSFFNQTPNETASIGYYLTFLNNFDFIVKGAPDASILSVLWSVAIEEQFYLVWPIILYFLPIRKYWMAFVTIILGSILFRALYDTSVVHEHHTLSCIGDMAIGASGAWLIIQREKFKESIVNLSRMKIIAIYILLAVVFFFRDEILLSNQVVRILERPIIALVMIAVVLEQCFSKNSIFKMSQLKTVSKLGLITYGLYCLHFIGILITTTLTNKLSFNTELWQVLLFETFCALSLTLVIGTLSYRFYEKPFLRLKDRFAYITK